MKIKCARRARWAWHRQMCVVTLVSLVAGCSGGGASNSVPVVTAPPTAKATATPAPTPTVAPTSAAQAIESASPVDQNGAGPVTPLLFATAVAPSESAGSNVTLIVYGNRDSSGSPTAVTEVAMVAQSESSANCHLYFNGQQQLAELHDDTDDHI